MAMGDEAYAWLESLVADALGHGSKASDWEKGFLTDQQDRMEKYGQDIRLSPKQWAILDRIANKIGHPPRDDKPDDDGDRY